MRACVRTHSEQRLSAVDGSFARPSWLMLGALAILALLVVLGGDPSVAAAAAGAYEASLATYMLTLTATGADGRRSAPVRVKFWVLVR